MRNPIYLGVVLLFSGEALLFRATVLLEWAVVAFLAFHLFVVLYEEPTLRRKFGESYGRYCDSVHRRDDTIRLGMEPFRPFADSPTVMGYYQVPEEILEDADSLSVWFRKAVAVAGRKKRK